MRVAWWADLLGLSAPNAATALSGIVVMVRVYETRHARVTLSDT